MNRIRLPLVIILISVCVALLVGFASGRATSTTHVSNSAGAIALQNAFVSVFRAVSPSVVQIQTTEGLGSGIVFDTKGDIVTNAHVVGEAKSFVITLASGETHKGTLVGTFPAGDLAVVRMGGARPKPAAFMPFSRPSFTTSRILYGAG